MNSIVICTDGSSRRNGKPDCVGGYGVWTSEEEVLAGYELSSTSQRAELLAMLKGLTLGYKKVSNKEYTSVIIITDSGYIANCIKDQWYTKWIRLGWITSTGAPVKNIDLWKQIVDVIDKYPTDTLQVYQIKGHLYEKCAKQNEDALKEGLDKFGKNNYGAAPPIRVFKKFVRGHAIADITAARARDIGDDDESPKTVRTVIEIDVFKSSI